MSVAALEEALLLHQAMISNNYEKTKKQRCRTAFTVSSAIDWFRLPRVIVISIVSVGRMDALTG